MIRYTKNSMEKFNQKIIKIPDFSTYLLEISYITFVTNIIRSTIAII